MGLNGNGDAAAAGTEVKHLAPLRGALDDQFDEPFRLRPRHQYLGADRQPQAEELLFAGDVGPGLLAASRRKLVKALPLAG